MIQETTSDVLGSADYWVLRVIIMHQGSGFRLFPSGERGPVTVPPAGSEQDPSDSFKSHRSVQIDSSRILHLLL